MIDPTLVDVFKRGGIIAYPTEAVFGLGCDPDNEEAILRLLSLKSRHQDKGLILIAGDYSQLLPYVDDEAIPQAKRLDIFSRWPGPITQILPAKKGISPLLTGKFASIAVRITQHPDIIALCQQTGKPIISTSANISGQPALKTWQQIQDGFSDQVDFILKTDTLGLSKPSTIINALTGEILRS